MVPRIRHFLFGYKNDNNKMGGVLSLAFISSLLAMNPHIVSASISNGNNHNNEVDFPVSYTSVDSCSAEHTASAWDSMIRCRPRPTLVQLPLPVTGGDSGSILQVIPGHVMVDRCSGSCDTPSHSCLPTAVENTTLEVMAVQTTYSSGAWNTLCSLVNIERHLSCECSCRVRPRDCDPVTQYYDQTGCQCRCKNQVARVECLSSGKHWDDSTCSCLCPRRTWRPCSTGFSFDYRSTCRCVRIHAAASGGVLTGLVVLFSVVLLSLGALVVHLRRRQELMANTVPTNDQESNEDGIDGALPEITTAFVEDEHAQRQSRESPIIRDRSGSQ